MIFDKENLTDYFQFFDVLRDSGKVNMFGAYPYLAESFKEVSMADAKKVFMLWGKTFEEDKPATDRAEVAIKALNSQFSS